LGFSGGGSSQTKPHQHNGLTVNDGGSLNLDNVTQGDLTSGDITYSDGTHLQRLAIGGAGDSLVVDGAGNFPEWAASTDPHNAGMTVMWSGTNAAIPAGWLLCDGASVATATYPALFTALGYAYGGAGANFNLPDLVARFPKGSATQTATTGGANSKTLSTAEMPSHTHTVTDPGHNHQFGGGSGGGSGANFPTTMAFQGLYTYSATTGITNSNTGGGGSFDNQPAFLELQYIIKT
jgi:microcystin-dependent protein